MTDPFLCLSRDYFLTDRKQRQPHSLLTRPKMSIFLNSKVAYLLNEKELSRAISPACRSRQAPPETRWVSFATRALFLKSTFEFIIRSKNRK